MLEIKFIHYIYLKVKFNVYQLTTDFKQKMWRYKKAFKTGFRNVGVEKPSPNN